MDSTVPRSTVPIPVAVTVASDKEPVECSGILKEYSHGFELGFSIKNDKFSVLHTAESTRVTAAGELSYDIPLMSGETSAVLETLFGKIRFSVKTLVRDIVRSENSLKILLKYILSSETAGEIERTVDISARFLH